MTSGFPWFYSFLRLFPRAALGALCLGTMCIFLGSFIPPADTLPMPKVRQWTVPDTNQIGRERQAGLITYGRALIMHTSRFFGPKGSVAQLTNGMNCQNCHLSAGTIPFGNNYSAVAATYPKYRDRSGTVETLTHRINDCFQRSLNGRAPDSTCREFEAMRAYIMWVGKDVPAGQTPEGSGLKQMTFLPRAASPRQGRKVYERFCAQCHQLNGGGVPMADEKEYQYPPLWGRHSYNDASGLYRISNFARYVRYNMPFGVRVDSTVLSDEQAWDVAAYVNSKPRPHKATLQDYPTVSKKPVDHPFAPWADHFPQRQHKLGPFGPIVAFYNKSKQ